MKPCRRPAAVTWSLGLLLLIMLTLAGARVLPQQGGDSAANETLLSSASSNATASDPEMDGNHPQQAPKVMKTLKVKAPKVSA